MGIFSYRKEFFVFHAATSLLSVPVSRTFEITRFGAQSSPIRKRPAGPRRAVSQSQPQAQGLDPLAEAAGAVEPVNIPPPSGQSPASTASPSDG
jgi:hypothetical protein